MTEVRIERRRSGWDIVGGLMIITGVVILAHVLPATAVSVIFLGWLALTAGRASGRRQIGTAPLRREPRWARRLGDSGHPWLLTAEERGNDASGLPAWCEGNAVRVLIDGRRYLPVLAAALARVDQEDAVLFAGWRTDPEHLLDDDGPPVTAALVGAACRGAVVRGLVWRSHPAAIGHSLEANRAFARAVTAAGGRLLLDQRIRPLGSQHHKFVVVTGAADDVAFVGGIDTARSRRDGHSHGGDRQARPLSAVYGPTPAWHDVQAQLRGPVVRDVETVFRQRWNDPTPTTRWPWHTIPDRLHGIHRTSDPLPPPSPATAPAGSCTVQLLLTYPPRRPSYPYARDGERSVARGYAKALARRVTAAVTASVSEVGARPMSLSRSLPST